MDRNFPRLLDTLQLVPTSRKVSAAEIYRQLLARGHTASRRTVERDLKALSTHYSIECDTSSKPYSWRWAKGTSPAVIGTMDLSHAIALQLFEREFATMLSPSMVPVLEAVLKAAHTTLDAQSHTQAARFKNKVLIRPLGSPLLPAKVSATVLAALGEALFTERQIHAEYRRAGATQHQVVRLHPLGLIRTGLVTYLVAVFDGHSDPRLLAAHRLRRVHLLQTSIGTPPGFDLNAYLLKEKPLQFGSGQQIQLRMRMPARTAAHLYDTPLSKDQVITQTRTDAAYVTVSATVNDSPQLLWWLLGFGQQVEVLAPKRLQKAIREH